MVHRLILPSVLLCLILMVSCTRSSEPPMIVDDFEAVETPLTYWLPKPQGGSVPFAGYLDNLLMYSYLEERTGVQVEFIYPFNVTPPQQLASLIASDKLPDLIEWNWLVDYPGGPDAAIAEGIIVDLSDEVRAYAPNLVSLFRDSQDLAKLVTSEQGAFYGFPSIKLAPETRASIGPVFRSSWLEETGHQVPATIDEWHSVLRTMKSVDVRGEEPIYPLYLLAFRTPGSADVAYPFLVESNIFAGAYGTAHSFYWKGERAI